MSGYADIDTLREAMDVLATEDWAGLDEYDSALSRVRELAEAAEGIAAPFHVASLDELHALRAALRAVKGTEQ